MFKGHPTVSGGQLILAAQPGTRADIQSKTVCQYGILHAVITSSDWKPQTSTTDTTFGFEFFDGNCHYGVILVANGILGLLRSEPDHNNDCSTQSAGIPNRLPSDPKFQEYIPISNWDTVRLGRTIFLTLIWTPSGVTLHVSDGGSNSGVASYSGVAVPNTPLKIRLNADFGETYSIDYIRVGNLLLRLHLNQTTFHTGNTVGSSPLNRGEVSL